MVKQYKIDRVQELNKRLEGKGNLIFTNFSGVKVTELNELRSNLREKGADYNITNNNGSTALRIAAYKNCFEIVKAIIEKGADVNQKKESGWTVLMAACSGGNLEIVKYLLTKGADINAIDQYGRTALDVAIRDGYKKIKKLLIEAGGKRGRELK